VWLLLSLLVLKAAATSATVGSGAVGGIFTPTLFVGAALGSLFGAAVVRWAPFLSAGQQSYALVGMGGLLAGTTHAPLMAIMMIFEMSLEYSVVLPLMLCCVLASFMSRRIWSESIYTEPLQRTDTSWRVAPEALVMTSIRVSEVMHGEVVSVRNTAPFAEVVDKFFRSRRNNLYVVDGQNKFLGAIALHDLKELLHRREELSFLIAHDLLNPDFPVATPDERLAQVFEKFLVQECERLPVVDNVKARTLIGSISKRDIIGVYGQEILHKDLLLTRFARRTSRGVESHYVELPAPYEIEEITVSEALNGKQIREIDLSRRFGLLALIIKRTDDLGEESSRVADGAHRVQKGDRLLVLGTPENIERFEKLAVPMGARGSGAAEKRP
jgi:CBS domain-containing protein